MTPSGNRPGVLFDVDGTLLDTNYLHVLAWWQAFRDAGHEGIDMATVHRAIGIASAELVRQILGREDEAAVQAHSTRYEALQDQVVAFPRTAELLAACADRGLGVVLATSGQESDLEWMKPAIGAEQLGPGRHHLRRRRGAKPAPDLLTTARTRSRPRPAADGGRWATPCGTSRPRTRRGWCASR